MELKKLAIVFLALIVWICAAKNIIQISRPVEIPEVVDATVNIITSCYENKGKAVAIVGNVPDNFIKKLWSIDHFPVVLIDNTTISESAGEDFHMSLSSKLSIFALVASTNEELRNRMVQITETPWYNHMASFIVPDWSPYTSYTLEQVRYRLDFLCKNNIYNAKIVSLDPESKIVRIYGYNPHTNNAPKPWNAINTYPNRRHGNFTILMREYRQNDEESCKNQDFDKTLDLGGDEIEVFRAGTQPFWEGVNINCYRDGLWNMVANFASHVNAKTRFVYPKDHDAVTVEEIKDVTVIVCYQTPAYIARLTSPIFDVGEFFITQLRGDRTQLSKILGIIDFNSQISVCLVLFLSLLFFKFFVRQAIAPAFLNIVRITSNTGFTNLPQNEPSRIYLAGLFIFVVTMQGIFTGNLSSLLTSDMSLPNPNTLQDLADYGYTIYSSSMNLPYFMDPIFEGRVVAVNSTQMCVDAVLRDPINACVDSGIFLKDVAADCNFHMSRDPIAKHSFGLLTVKHWPFLKNFDKIVRAMNEADVMNSLNISVKAKRQNEAREEAMNYHVPKVMTLKNLGFAFVILAIGWALGTVSFILEIAIHRKKTRKTKVHSLIV